MIIVEKGVFAAAAKKPAIPTTANALGSGANLGQIEWIANPRAPPALAPITIEGPNTPPEPPEPIVRLVVSILPIAMANNSPAPSFSGSVNDPCTAP